MLQTLLFPYSTIFSYCVTLTFLFGVFKISNINISFVLNDLDASKVP